MRPDEYRWFARAYDRVLKPFLNPLRREIAEACRKTEIRRILDVGCGTGDQCRRLREAGMDSLGLEASPSMLAVARTRLGHGALTAGDARRLPFADQSQDAVLLCLVLHAMPQPDRLAALREACRVGRRVVLVDYRNAERNLDTPAVLFARCLERLAGSDHYACYRDFRRRNAVEGLVAVLREGITEQEAADSPRLRRQGQGGPARAGELLLRRPALAGAASLIVWEPTRSIARSPGRNPEPR